MQTNCRCEGTQTVTVTLDCEEITIPCPNCQPSDVSLIKIERSKRLHPFHIEELE